MPYIKTEREYNLKMMYPYLPSNKNCQINKKLPWKCIPQEEESEDPRLHADDLLLNVTNFNWSILQIQGAHFIEMCDSLKA